MLLGFSILYFLLGFVSAGNGQRERRDANDRYVLNRDENIMLHQRCGELPGWHGINRLKSIGGTPTTTRQAPWSVSLQYLDDAGESYFCSGTLISDKHVLTAAHCLIQHVEQTNADGSKTIVEKVRHPSNFKFSFDTDCGKHYVNNCIMNPLFTRYGLRAYVPKGFRASRSDTVKPSNDITIFELDRKIPDRNFEVIPACLQPIDPKVGDEIWMFGYGGSSKNPSQSNSGPLLYSSTRIVDCSKWAQNIPGKDNFCTQTTQHPCTGDSGAGLITNTSRSYAVMGIHSSAITECYLRDGKSPDEYVDIHVAVYPHGKWICEYTGICMSGLFNSLKNEYVGGIDIIEDPHRMNTIQACGGENWYLEEIHGKRYCYLTIPFKQRLTVMGAFTLCQSENSVVTPIRYPEELGAIKIAMDAAGIRRRPDRMIVVGGEVDATGKAFRWSYDNSPVNTDVANWIPGRPSNPQFAPGSRCMTLNWYDPYEAGAPPSKLGYNDIACDGRQAVGVTCMKDADRIDAPRICGDDSWVVAQRRTEDALCFKVIHFQKKQNVNEAKTECSNLGGELAPIRSKAELEAVSEAYHRLYQDRKVERSFIVGGQMDKSGWNFSWGLDMTTVSNSTTAWLPDKPSYGLHGKERCMRAVWYTASEGANPSDLRFDDIDCTDYYDATGAACVKLVKE